MGSLTWAFRDGRRSFIAGGEVANATTPADTKIAPAHNDAPALGASALARSVAERTIALKRIVVRTKFSRTLDDATTRAHAWEQTKFPARCAAGGSSWCASRGSGGGFTSLIRLFSRNDGRGWFLFDF